jgi:hypothetical protein
MIPSPQEPPMQNAVARREGQEIAAQDGSRAERFQRCARALYRLAQLSKEDARNQRLSHWRDYYIKEHDRLIRSAWFYRRHARMERGE